jgi:hypothetical protein
VPPIEAEVGKEEDSSDEEEKSVEPVNSGLEEAVVIEEEAVPQVIEAEQSPAIEPKLAQVVTAAAASAFDVTGLKEEVAPEIVPLAIPEVEETEQAIIPPITDVESRGATPSLLEELQKLRE